MQGAALIPNPIGKVLSTLHICRVQHLLMGGQACVFYGAAEFSRDTDIVILAGAGNLARLNEALANLHADCIAVPPLSLEYLAKGHAIHYRCHHPDAEGIRLDMMSILRGVESFPILWERRTTVELAAGTSVDLLSVQDLVQAKKTQRDKDWPMLQRLVEAHYEQNRTHPNPEQVSFWLQESRTPEMLVELVRSFPVDTTRLLSTRPLLNHALTENLSALRSALHNEEEQIRAIDRAYWAPLKKELEELRHGAH